MKIHWLGLGLSSYAGVRRVAESGTPLLVWARDLGKASKLLEELGVSADLAPYTLEVLARALEPGDFVVSMFPAPMHPPIARACVDRRAHLVTTSYVSDAMRALDSEARAAGVTLLNEVGLDPGLDHWMAHELFESAGEAFADPRAASYSFVSLCGGFPAEPGDFKYRFSWSPAGVLRALKNPATWIEGGETRTSPTPGRDAKPIEIEGHTYEMYPNRDSTAYVSQYASQVKLPARDFVRGTLRPQGWTKSWTEILEILPSHSDSEIEELAAQLWAKHAYTDGDHDRVVLHCALRVLDGRGETIWQKALTLDESGTMPYDSAMNRLVSLPAAIGVSEIARGRLAPGIQIMPHEGESRLRWAQELAKAGIKLNEG